MGLDVYLYKYENFDLTVSTEKKYSDKTNAHKIEIDSEKHPEHMFKIGYWRSSYNGGGINRVLANLTGKNGLYWIVEPKRNDYYVRPDWEKAKKRSERMLSMVKSNLKKQGSVDCMSIRVNNLSPQDLTKIQSTEDALKVYRKQIEKHAEQKGAFDSYGCRDGDFWLKEPLKVHGIIMGMDVILNPVPCAYVIFEKDYDWYTEALDVVIETCEYVLAQSEDERHKFVLHWSG